MKTLQVTAPRQFEILDLPIPTPGPGEVLMQILAVTTCPQWDLHLRHNEPMFVGHQFNYPYMPGQPGHEAAGVIAAVGPGVTAVKPGIASARGAIPAITCRDAMPNTSSTASRT